MTKKITGEIPDEYRNDVQEAIDNARKFMQDGQDLAAVAIIVRNGDKTAKPPIPATVRIIGTVFDQSLHNQDKNAWAQLVRSEAAEIGADFIIFSSEVWLMEIPKEHAKTQQEADAFSDYVLRTYGSIGNSPYRKDSVMFSLYTREGEYVGTAPIKKFGKTRTFDDVTFFKNAAKEERGKGYRFSDLLPARPKDMKP